MNAAPSGSRPQRHPLRNYHLAGDTGDPGLASHCAVRALWSIGFLAFSATVSAAPIARGPAPIRSYSYDLPLAFQVNDGQTDHRVRFLARGENYTLFLTASEAVFALSLPGTALRQEPEGKLSGATASGARTVVRMQLIDSSPDPRVQALEELPGKVNYLRGKDARHWRTNIPIYERVKYDAVYPGIDLIYYGHSHRLEYDFIVSPGADPNVIRLVFAGVNDAALNSDGDLVLTAAGEHLRFHRPILYQLEGGRRKTIDGGYVHVTPHEIGFHVGAYDHTRPLIIDPELSYSTHLGGSADDSGEGITVDPAGAAYVAGHTSSTDFPTAKALQPTHEGIQGDAFVAKLNPEGTALVYATYIGGSKDDGAQAIAIDRAGAAYITGFTDSPDFPSVRSLASSRCTAAGGVTSRDSFVAKLAADGSRLIYSTCLGGSRDDNGQAIAVDDWGAAYVGGRTFSCDFPTVNAFAPACHNPGTDDLEAFVAKLTPDGTALAYSTYLGGTGSDEASGIAVDSRGDAYVVGSTTSLDFPILHPAQPAFSQGEDNDAFAARFASDGKSLVYSMRLGGSANDAAAGVAIGQSGAAYVTGTTSSADFPTVNALQPTYGGGTDAFVLKIRPEGGSLIYSTYLGGSGRDESFGITADTEGAAYVTGWTFSPDFPPAILGSGGNGDAFVAKLDPNGRRTVYATKLGGGQTDAGHAIGVDLADGAYVTGFTYSADFPTQQPLQAPGSSDTITDAFVTKLTGDKLRVTIDIKPGASPNTLNPRSEGVITVAILSTAGFDATTVAPLSVRFGARGATEVPERWHIQDVNQDGRLDLVLRFRTDGTRIRCGDGFAILTGEANDGGPIVGADTIRTVGCMH